MSLAYVHGSNIVSKTELFGINGKTNIIYIKIMIDLTDKNVTHLELKQETQLNLDKQCCVEEKK